MTHKFGFIVAEGINGSGKTTVMREVAKRLRADLGEADRVVTLFNPTQGPIGTELRKFVSDQRDKGFPRFFSYSEETLSFATTLALLFAADRHMMQGTIREAISDGKVVLCDRYSLSTIVYQCAMIGDIHYQSQLAHLIELSHKGVMVPDTTIVFDIPPDVARARLLSRGERNDDRMMAQIEPAARSMYLDAMNKANHVVFPGVVKIINADRPIEDVIDETYEYVRSGHGWAPR